MLHIRSRIAPTIAAVVVAGPLLYFTFVGRQAPLLIGYCGVAGPRDEWRYGWPAIYGTRIIAEEWLGEPRTVGPLEGFCGQSLFWNLIVSAAMIGGSFSVVRIAARAFRKRQFSLRSLVLLPAVTAGVCIFVKYDQSPNLYQFAVPCASAVMEPAFRPIVFRPQAITDFPIYLCGPILFGVAAGIYVSLSAATTLIARLCRMTGQSSSSSPAPIVPRRILAALALVCLIGSAFYLGRVAYRWQTACRTAVFGKLATKWVAEYVMVHDGEWPRSWGALRECANHSGSNPEEMIEAVQSYVVIDFHADPCVLANQTAKEFRAIRPLDGYGVDDQEFWDIPFLIETLQDLRGRAADPPQPQTGARLGGAGRDEVQSLMARH